MGGRVVAAALCVAVLVACSDDDGSAAELCAAVRDDPSITQTFAGFDPTDQETALEQLRSARVTLGRLQDAAPGEVRDDLKVEIDYVQDLVDGLAASEGRDAEEVVQTVQRITDEHPKVAGAAQRLEAYTRSTCR